MATVAERSKELAVRLEAEAITNDGSGYDKEWYEERAVTLIEQALLAERRLARLEDAEIAHTMSEEWTDRVKTDEHTRGMADGADFVAMALRAAAEKESGPRGGE